MTLGPRHKGNPGYSRIFNQNGILSICTIRSLCYKLVHSSIKNTLLLKSTFVLCRRTERSHSTGVILVVSWELVPGFTLAP